MAEIINEWWDKELNSVEKGQRRAGLEVSESKFIHWLLTKKIIKD